MTEHDLSAQQIADICCTGDWMIYRLLNGHVPSLRLAVDLSGIVEIESWLEPATGGE